MYSFIEPFMMQNCQVKPFLSLGKMGMEATASREGLKLFCESWTNISLYKLYEKHVKVNVKEKSPW